MEWTRFPIPEFDYKPLAELSYEPPDRISPAQALDIAAASLAGDASVAGAYATDVDEALAGRLDFRGEQALAVLCALPVANAHLLARSRAWFNQRVFVLDDNSAGATVLHEWRTPRTYNTRFGPEDGVSLDRPAIWIFSGRILDDQTRANRVMIDSNWEPGNGRQGYRIMAASDAEPSHFHDSCFELTWTPGH